VVVNVKVQEASPRNSQRTTSQPTPAPQDTGATAKRTSEQKSDPDETSRPEAGGDPSAKADGENQRKNSQSEVAHDADVLVPLPPEMLPAPHNVPIPEDEEVTETKPMLDSSLERHLTEEAIKSEGLRKRTSSFRGASFHSLRQNSMEIDPEKMGGSRPLGQALGKPFPKRPMGCKISVKVWKKLEEFFRMMDVDGSNAVTREEARAFFKGAFAGLSAEAMFNEVDVDGSGAITAEEFVAFWIQVRKSGYKDQDVLDELEELMQGGAWVDWKDGRTTANSNQKKFPRRPIFSRLSAKTWMKCEQLFKAMDTESAMVITRFNAETFFKGAFSNISVQAMFNEIDVSKHGTITADEWMTFWSQVRASGYSNKDITEEVENLLDGNSAWVDWKDGRTTAGKQNSMEIS